MTRRLLVICVCFGLLGLSPLVVMDADAGPPGAVGDGAKLPGKTADISPVTRSPGRGIVALQILETEIVSQVTGRESPNDTASRWNVHGTDLGHMFWHGDTLYMVFGDTFGAPGPVGPKNWRSNTMARIADWDPQQGISIDTMITGPNGAAKELLSSRKIPYVERTVIPTYGISIDGRMHLHYMSVKNWGEAGHWTVNYSGIAYSDDSGQTWTKSKDATWPANSGFEQVAFVLSENMLYTFGIPEGRFGGVKLRRTSPKRILDTGAYEYWDGRRWVGDRTSAAMIVPAPVGELSVAWSEPYGQWMMMYLDDKQQAIVLRTAPRLTGPWGDAQVVTTTKEYPELYAPYIVPGSEIGSHLYYTMSMWKPYNVFLMRTGLEPVAPPPNAVAGDPVPKATSVAAPAIKQN